MQRCSIASEMRAWQTQPARAHQVAPEFLHGPSHYLALRAMSGRIKALVHMNVLEAGLYQSRQVPKEYKVALLIKQ